MPLVFVSGPGSEARNSIGTVLVTGMTIGTIFTLFIVPVFYSFLAAEHKPSEVGITAEIEGRPLLGGAQPTPA
jgi:multidrug efflux pump